MTKTTDWFPGHIEPLRVGWYEVREFPTLHHSSRGKLHSRPWRYWAGKSWRTGSPDEKWSSNQGISIFGTHSAHQWRGLTQAAARAAQAQTKVKQT